jgi:hypothetical protein
VEDIYAGKDTTAPQGMDNAVYSEIHDWAQRGKELGIPQDLAIEVATTHISRALEGVPTKDHKNTLRDLTETVEFAREAAAPVGGSQKELSASEKKAAFLASMDPKVAKYYLDAKDRDGKPLFTPEEKFLYEQYGVLRIFLENGGKPDPKTLLQFPEERDAFLAVTLPNVIRNETEAQMVVSYSIVELLKTYSGITEKEAKKIISDELGEVQFLAKEAAGMIPDAQVHPIEDDIIPLSAEDLFYETALEIAVGPVFAEEITKTTEYLRDSDPTLEFDADQLTNPYLGGRSDFEKEKEEFLNDLGKTRVWQGAPTIELGMEDFLGDVVDGKGKQYQMSEPRAWTDVVSLQPGQLVARIEGSADSGAWKDFNDGKGRQRAVRVTLSIEEAQSKPNGQVAMVEHHGLLTVWMTPEKAKEAQILPINHNNYWVLSELN